MPDKQALHTALNLNTGSNAPEFILYSPLLTERLKYTSFFIFSHVLKSNCVLTDSLSVFENSQAYKLNYSEEKIEGVVQIIPGGLIFETGIAEAKPEALIEKDNLYFFAAKSGSGTSLAFDVFSAVFYFISRYEEWQPFDKDKHGRFEAAASLLFRHNFHLQPVVDQWILSLRASLERCYPSLKFEEARFTIISTMDVDNVFAYRSKGFLRTLGACIKDCLRLDLQNLFRRLKVVAGKAEDPFDIYEPVSSFCEEQHIPLIWFFLFKTGTLYDRTLDPMSTAFSDVLSRLKKRLGWIGLHPSYDSAFEPSLLATEVQDFSSRLDRPVEFSRQHFLRFDIRTTPALLLSQGIRMDFSMGFASSPGFRAGTSYPFFYYDFLNEKSSELLFVPFCAMDGAYLIYNPLSHDEVFASLMELAREIKKVNGNFISIFHERSFSDHLYPGFGLLYKKLHLRLKELQE